MAASAREFFESIEARLDPEKLKGETLSYRFDIEGAGSWKIDVVDGAPTVTESADAADCVIRMKEETLLKLIDGKTESDHGLHDGKDQGRRQHGTRVEAAAAVLLARGRPTGGSRSSVTSPWPRRARVAGKSGPARGPGLTSVARESQEHQRRDHRRDRPCHYQL